MTFGSRTSSYAFYGPGMSVSPFINYIIFAGGFHYLQLVDSDNKLNRIVDVCVLVYSTEIAEHGSSNRLIAKVHGCKVHAVCNFVHVTILQM
jgi:hypothetical protein